MKQIIKRFSVLTIALICGLAMSACAASEKTDENKAAGGTAANENKSAVENKTAKNESSENAQKKSIEVFDGRGGAVKNTKPSEAEIALVEKDVRVKSQEDFLKKQLGGLAENVDWSKEFSVSDVAEGAFTKPNSKQKAVLYRYSYTNGVVIVEDGNIVAHFSGGPGDYAFYTAIKSLPDVNQNGLSEIILFRNVEDNEDVIPYLFESKDGAIKFLGEGKYFSSSYAAGDDTDSEKAKQTAYRVTVEPSKNPTFLQETFERTASKGSWKLTKKAEKFSWEKRGGDYDLTKI